MHHLHAFILVVSERTICIRFLKNYANYNHLSFHWVIDLKHVTSLKKRLWYSCFPVSFNKYLRRLTEHLLSTVSFVIYSGLSELFTNFLIYKRNRKISKSIKFGINSIDTICWNNFFTYQRLILLYHFHQKILKRKTTIFKSFNFLNQTCFLHYRDQVFAHHAYNFTSLISRFISMFA